MKTPLEIEEIQNFINNNDFLSLSKTKILEEFVPNLYRGKSKYEYGIYKLNKNFILDYMLDYEKIKESIKLISNNSSSFIYGIFIEEIPQIINAYNIYFNLDDWKVYVHKILKLVETEKLYDASSGKFFQTTDKNADFIQLFLDDFYYNKMLGLVNKIHNIFKFNNTLTDTQLSKIPTDSFSQSLLERLSYFKKCRLIFENQPSILKFFETPQNAITYVKNNETNMQSVYLGEMLQEFPQDEFEKMMMDDFNVEKSLFGKVSLKSRREYVRYYTYNNVPIKDEVIDELTFRFGSLYSKILDNLTDKQIEERFDKIGPEILCKKVSMVRLKELFGSNINDISSARFFTNEEIQGFPNFFNPESILKAKRVYITKETLKILNGVWKTNKRYSNDLSDFNKILSNNSYSFLNMEMIKYLKEKTKSNNLDVYKFISNNYIPENLKKLQILKKFMDIL